MASQSVRNHLLSLCYRDLRDYFREELVDHPVFVHDEYTGPGCALLPGLGSQEVAATLLLNGLVKKFEDEASVDAPNRCLLAFLESNFGCSLWEEPSPLSAPLVIKNGYQHQNDAYKGFIEAARRTGFIAIQTCLRDTFCRPTPESLCEIPGFDGSNPWSWENVFLMGDNGPGASVEASGTAWLDKFYLGSISFTNSKLLEVYEHDLGSESLRSIAENQRRSQYGFSQVLGGVYGSVPKSYDTDRSIETQPALEMWAQKGISKIMEHFVRAKYGVDLSVQPEINKELARRGSIFDDLVTIDLSEASNRISYRLIQSCLADTDVLGVISEARVSKTRLPWGEYIDLHMCSTMGNAYTFILETAVFLAVVEATYLAHGKTMGKAPRLSIQSGTSYVNSWVEAANPSGRIPGHLSRYLDACRDGAYSDLKQVTLPSWGVFGDDIIVPTTMCDTLKFYLETIGASVNSSKSFETGPFRESCGGDFFQGVNVRAVYCRTLKSQQDKISLINRLNAWTARVGIPLRRLCGYLMKGVSEKLLVPLHEADDAGLKCPSSMAPKYPASKAVQEASEAYQRTYVPYRFFKARPYSVTYEGRQLVIYGPGLLLSMLKGETASSWSSGPDPGLKRRCGDYLLALSKRNEQGSVQYDARWGMSYDWDMSPGNSIDVKALAWAISVNLGHF